MGMTNLDAICIYGAQVMSKHLNAMAGEVEGVREGKDIEYIHRMRVASRRTRSTLGIFQSCFPKKEYKQILKHMRTVTRALGEARDLDVQIALLTDVETQFSEERLKPGIRRLMLRLNQKRMEAQQHVDTAMDMLTNEKVLEGIMREYLAPALTKTGEVYIYSPALYQLAFDNIKTRIDELFSHERYIHDPANKLELHAMRISAKRLRYTLEAFENLYLGQLKSSISTMREIQDLLGLIHDMDVWAEFIPAFIEEERQRILIYFGNERPLKRLLPGLQAFQSSRTAQRDETYHKFIAHWQEIKLQGSWEKLQNLIQTPIDLEAALQFRKTQMNKPDEIEEGNDIQAPDQTIVQ